MKNHKIKASQLAEFILGKTLTVPEIVALVREEHPGLEIGSVWVAMKTLRESPNCEVVLSLKDKNRAYHLVRVDAKFYRRAGRSIRRSEDGRGSHFNADEPAWIHRVGEFDRLLQSARAQSRGV